MERPSGAAEATSPRPQVIGHPSGSPRVEVVSSSSGGVTLADSKVMKALMIMQSCYNSDATMTVCRLAEVRERFYILMEYDSMFLCPGSSLTTPSRMALGMSTDTLEAGLWYLLHPMIEACLDGWQILPSQMAPNLCAIWWCSSGNVMGRASYQPRLVHRLLPLVLGAGRVLLDHPKQGEEVNGSCSSRPALPPPSKAPIEALGERSTYEGEKHLGGGGGELPKKKTKVAVSKRPRKVALKETSERAHRGKGKELGLHFVGALIDHAHDAGWAVRFLTERNSVLRAENKELKAGASPEAVATAEKRATKLSVKVDQLNTILWKSEQCCKDLELEANSTRVKLRDIQNSQCQLEDEVLSLMNEVEMLQSKLKVEGDKAIVDYKKSRGF
ncbi:hypothetical protein B296_00019272 [Ensete ventricosum]|uniref:Uncharacterized protein n=1 Tax=Ensete ventricosum TaxID=4639 RepID=A0A427ACR2_ENSVE|nr:hypothetical protein B296_00019272 [Ensete ventricosum]